MNPTDKSSSGPSLSNISVAVTTQALTSAPENSVIFSTTNQESKSREEQDTSENSKITSANSGNILNSSASSDVQEAVIDTFDDDIVKEEIEIKDAEQSQEEFSCEICDFKRKWGNGLEIHMTRKHGMIEQVDGAIGGTKYDMIEVYTI